MSENLSSHIQNFLHKQYHSNHQNDVNSISNNFGYNKNTCGISMNCTFRSGKSRTLRSDYPLPNTKIQMKIGIILASSWSPLKNTKTFLCEWKVQKLQPQSCKNRPFNFQVSLKWLPVTQCLLTSHLLNKISCDWYLQDFMGGGYKSHMHTILDPSLKYTYQNLMFMGKIGK